MTSGEASEHNSGSNHAAADAAAVAFAARFRPAIQWAINHSAIPSHDRKDMEQEVRIRLLQRFRRLGPVPADAQGALGYAVQVALSTCRSYHKKRRAEVGRADCVGDGAVAHDALPDELSERTDRSERLRAAVMGLPGISRSVMRLVLQGRDLASIAQELRLPIGTVKSLTHRARLLLRKRLAR